MTKKKKVKIPLYYGDLYIIYTDNWEEAFTSSGFDSEEMENTDGHFCSCGTHEFYIFMATKSPGAIAHEAKHFINRLFKLRGVKLSRTNDEAECYLLTWAVDQIHNFIND